MITKLMDIFPLKFIVWVTGDYLLTCSITFILAVYNYLILEL